MRTMYWVLFLFMAVATAQATIYLPPSLEEDQLLTDAFLRELINQMGIEFADASDSYLEYHDQPKEIPIKLPVDYDGIDTLNRNPSLRDPEYLHHSTLWRHRMNSNSKEFTRQKIKTGTVKNMKDEKAENTLPAYCTPPNPCPVGYTSENNCIMDFENTAEFSRDYQNKQDCMCDKDHMVDCPADSVDSNSLSNMHVPNANFNQIVDQFQAEENPFFRGEKLPIAAKKGTNVAD